MRNQEDDAALDSILGEMSNYAEKHLKDEEALLREHSYPDLIEQESDHAKYLEQMQAMFSHLEKDRKATAQEIYTFLRFWWINHIVGIDQKYGPFLREKGVT